MLTRASKEVLKKSPQDVVILSSVRSPIGRAYKGGFKDSYPEEILMPVCLEQLQKSGQFVDEIVPANTCSVNAETKEETSHLVEHDEGVCPGFIS